MGPSLLDFFVVAEDFLEIALDVFLQSRDGDDPQPSSGLEPIAGVAYDERQEFVAHFCGQVGDDGVKTDMCRHMTEAIAQIGATIGDSIALGVLRRVFNGDKVFIDQMYFALRTQMSQDINKDDWN